MAHLLALHSGGISEQLLFLPTLQALASKHDQTSTHHQLDVVIPPNTRDIYQLSSVIHQAIPFDFDASIGLADWSNLFGILREREYDAVITTCQGTGIRFFLWLLGIPARVGYLGGVGAFMMSDLVPYNDKQPLMTTYGDLLTPLGLNLSSSVIEIQSTPSDLAWFNSAQSSLGLNPNHPIILLYDEGSAGNATSYSPQNWKSVMAGIRDRLPHSQIMLLHYGKNLDWIEACKPLDLNVPVIHAATIGQAAAVIESAQWLISIDSAPLYLGAGSSTAVLGLFGPSHPEKLLPQRDRCQGLRAASGRLNDIPPIQILEQLIAS